MGMILEQAGIPLIMFVICLICGVRMIIMQEAGSIRGKNAGPLKDEKEYAKHGGVLLLVLAVSSLVMAVLMFINVYAAVVEFVVCTIVVSILWKKMNDKYGA